MAKGRGRLRHRTRQERGHREMRRRSPARKWQIFGAGRYLANRHDSRSPPSVAVRDLHRSLSAQEKTLYLYNSAVAKGVELIYAPPTINIWPLGRTVELCHTRGESIAPVIAKVPA